MALSIGIVGLPNVGKSTLFNALTKAQKAEAANYPFCTIEPNKATVPVQDKRLDVVAKLVHPLKTIYTTIDFIDIAGLVRGASKGEGLGNQFLGNIRECAAILHVVRCFEDGNITHVDGDVDPLRDVETIEAELILADIQSIERRLERTRKGVKGDKTLAATVTELEALLAHLDDGQPASTFTSGKSDGFKQVMKEAGLLSAKPVIYCGNVDENSLADSTSNPPWPSTPTSKVASNGPSSPPALAPAAISANRRLASALANTSASTLQASEISSRLTTEIQM